MRFTAPRHLNRSVMLGMVLLFCLVGVVRAWDSTFEAPGAVDLSAITDAGDLAVLSPAVPGQAAQLRLFNDDGSLTWQSSLLAANVVLSSIAVAGDRVNVARFTGSSAAASLEVYSFSLSSGQLIWRQVPIVGVDLRNGSFFIPLNALADGRLQVAAPTMGASTPNARAKYLMFSASGSMLAQTEFPDALPTVTAWSKNGNFLVGEGNALVSLRSPLGTRIRDVNMSTLTVGINNPRWALLDNQAVVVIGSAHDGNGLAAALFDGAGLLAWNRLLPGVREGSLSYAFDLEFLYTVSYRDSTDAIISKAVLDNGHVLWSMSLDRSVRFGDVLVSHTGRHFPALLSKRTNAVRIRIFDPETGQPAIDQYEPCFAQDCATYGARFLQDALFVQTRRFDPTPPGTSFSRLSVLGQVVRPVPTTRADQPGISGAWYPEYASGQGFHLQYFPDSRTIFMPWFTFTSSGGPGATPLRWYALQGTVAPGAQTATLDILRNQGGNFNAAPVTQAERVGGATLTFASCDRANLDYTFDSALGLGSGRITLTRLTARDAPCTLADGSVSPPAIATMSSAGFETRHSGAWYDPATSGQGLMFSVTPASGSNGGYFFAPWFTYDPQGAHDESTGQHWFTLQGDLRNAANGIAELVIYRTTGGRFDVAPATDTTRVGTATVRMLDCQRAQLDYRFDDSDAAGAFRARTGAIALQRIGGCAN